MPADTKGALSIPEVHLLCRRDALACCQEGVDKATIAQPWTRTKPCARLTSKQHPWRLQIFPDPGSVQLFVFTPQHKLCRQDHSDSTQLSLPLAASPNHLLQRAGMMCTQPRNHSQDELVHAVIWTRTAQRYLSPPMGLFGAIDGTAHGEAKSTGSQLTKSHMATTEWLGNVTIMRGVKGLVPSALPKSQQGHSPSPGSPSQCGRALCTSHG